MLSLTLCLLQCLTSRVQSMFERNLSVLDRNIILSRLSSLRAFDPAASFRQTCACNERRTCFAYPCESDFGTAGTNCDCTGQNLEYCSEDTGFIELSEARFSFGAIANGVNSLLLGLEVALALRKRFQWLETWHVPCPTAYASNESVHWAGGVDIWFSCVFQPFNDCRKRQVPTRVDNFKLSRLVNGSSIRAGLRQVSKVKEWLPCGDLCGRLEIRQFLAWNYVKLQPDVRGLVDQLKAQFMRHVSLPPAQELAAFQIRRGDKCFWEKRGPGHEAKCVHAARFVDMLNLHAKGNNISTIFVMTDDFKAVTEVQQSTHLRVVTMATPDLQGRDPKLAPGGARLEQERDGRSSLGFFADFWAEVEIAVSARVVIGSFSSNVGRLLAVLRSSEADGQQLPVISVDQRWHPA